MCDQKKNCCCEDESTSPSDGDCGKKVPHKEKGTEKEFPCGKERKNKDETCCCEDE